MIVALTTLASFVAASGIVLFAFLFVQEAPNFPRSRVRQRVSAMSQTRAAVRSSSTPLVKESIYSEIPWLHRILGQAQLTGHLELLLARAGVPTTVGLFVLASIAVGALTTLLLHLLGQLLFLGFAAGLGVAVSPYVYLRIQARRRLRRFLEQMPDALDTMSQGLQAGLGIGQAQAFLVREAPEPLRTEFGQFTEQLNLGLPMREALEDFEERVPLPELRLFGIALMVQRDVGGALGELLTKLSDVIRDRFRIEREIKTLTAQNRMSAWVVCSLPPALMFMMYTMNPELVREVAQDPIGKTMFIAAGIFWILGIIAFKRLLRLHI